MLNQSQQEAVSHGIGPMLVLAGPGSGKTTVITGRTRKLVEEMGVAPENILVITFTKAAATEMKNRFIRMCGGRDIGVNFGTFHAVFFKIIKYAYNYNSSNILGEDERTTIIRDIIRGMNLERDDERDFVENVAQEISKVKSERLNIGNYYSINCGREEFVKIYTDYGRKLEMSGKLDFDDMVLMCYELLVARKDILEFWQSRYEYVLIDEFQDINRLQYDTIRLLAAPQNNIFVVGDDDQSIYRFRGANPNIMLGFEKDYENCRKVLLDTNYRCGDLIVQGSLNLISNNKCRFNKEIKAVRSGKPVAVREFASSREQNLNLVKDIAAEHKRGMPLHNMAVLYRTNIQPRSLAEVLMEYNIPFRMRDKTPNLFDHWIAINFFDYINIACGSGDRAAALRIINRPKRYIARDSFREKSITLDGLRELYDDKPYVVERIEKLKYDLQIIRKQTPLSAIRYIRRAVGYDEFLKEYSDMKGIRLEELMNIADEVEDSANGFTTFQEWYSHIHEYRDKLRESLKADDTDRLQLMTFHGSKGLEFDRVYIIDVNEKITPYEKAVVPEDIEEERRMFYVAMTRAKDHLEILYTKERFGRQAEPSRFIGEMLIGRQQVAVGAKLEHTVYGKGEVISVKDDRITIKFEAILTPKVLSLSMCIERRLIGLCK